MKKLVLVNPVNPARTGLTVNKSSRFPPIGLGTVAALTPASWDVKLVDENWAPFAYQEADLVGITAFTASANRAYEIAALYRQQGVPVVMGGIHASMCPDEALRFVNAVVIGEAEAVWPRALADIEAGCLQQKYQGEWSDLSGMPCPRRDLFHPDYMFASVQTSRGCPMDCEFCSVTAFNGRRYRRRPAEEVLAELEQIPQKMLFFVDDNIIGYGPASRKQALALFKGMVKRKLDKWWFCQASLNFGDDEEVLSWASRAGCKMVFLGLEAEEIDALQEVHKQLNVQRGINGYKQAFRRIHKAGIAVLGAFIFGMDGDTSAKLQRRANYMIYNRGIDVMQRTRLTPLPGTRLFDRYQQEGRLLYTNFPQDWDHYDMTEVVHRPGSLDPEQMNQTMQKLDRRMYSLPVLFCKALITFWQTRNKIATMFAWNSNLNYRNVGRGIAR
ncbi:MAG: B12-binding domain-containing radical SAM protein [Deltaproteobacteria bacterium]|nr:B12-binding domain-containing radical SAM protein [Deltaproteobacteria bacterium]